MLHVPRPGPTTSYSFEKTVFAKQNFATDLRNTYIQPTEYRRLTIFKLVILQSLAQVLKTFISSTNTVFPRLETTVPKHFSFIVPRFQFEWRLLYEGRLLIFYQGRGLVIRYCKAVALLYNICTHAVSFKGQLIRSQLFSERNVFHIGVTPPPSEHKSHFFLMPEYWSLWP